MEQISHVHSVDWLSACRRAVGRIEQVLSEHSTLERRSETVGRGAGGDQTLVIDEQAEDAVFMEFDRLHSNGAEFSVISEERGEVVYGGGGPLRVVVDPIDGSLNAKRGLTHSALSVAVASGPTVADVVWGYVYDLGAKEEWVAKSGQGAYLNGQRLDNSIGEVFESGNKLELVGIESADPRWVGDSVVELSEVAYRLRCIGAIALTLCQVAASRIDGMLSLKACRSVDAAAGQLIVREAGGAVSFPGYPTLTAPLDLLPNAPVVAARSQSSLERLERVL